MIEGQDKVFKDVIEPLESASVTVIPTIKQDIRDFGPPKEVSLLCAINIFKVHFCFVCFFKILYILVYDKVATIHYTTITGC